MMNADQHYAYLKDITKEQVEKPQYVNIKGEKSLMPNHFWDLCLILLILCFLI